MCACMHVYVHMVCSVCMYGLLALALVAAALCIYVCMYVCMYVCVGPGGEVVWVLGS